MTEEDEAFEDLAKRQGDWGMQGSRKHQIMRFAENVENKGTSMTQDEIIALAKRVGFPIHHPEWRKAAEEFAALVEEQATAKERKWLIEYIQEHQPSCKQMIKAIDARGQA